MSTGDISLGHSAERGPQLAAAVLTPMEPVAGRRPQVGLATAQWAVVARHAVLPVCDGFALAVAALLTVPGWPAVGYIVVVLTLVGLSGRHRLRICLRVSDELPRLAAAVALPIPLLLPWMDSAAGLVRLAVLSAGLLVTMRAGLYAALRAAHRR